MSAESRGPAPSPCFWTSSRSPATDLARAVEFYGSVLGLSHEETIPFASVFHAGPVMVRVTKVDSLTPQPSTVLGWSVPDIRATVV